MKIGAFLTKLAAKTGVDITAPEFAEFLSSAIELPDAMASAFDSARIYTPESARNDHELKNMFFAQALNGVDTRISTLLDEYQLPDELRTTITGEPKTIEKIPAFIKAIKALESQKVGATAGEKANLQQQINALQAAKATEIQALRDEFSTTESGYRQRIQKMHIDRLISGKKLDTSKFDDETMLELAQSLLGKNLAQKGAKIVDINDTFVLKRAADESLDYYENNQAVTLDSFIDQVLAANKLLAVNDPAPAPGNSQHGQRQLPPSPTPTPNGQPQPTSNFQSKLDRAKADLALNSGA